jgi:hypothetical protein
MIMEPDNYSGKIIIRNWPRVDHWAQQLDDKYLQAILDDLNTDEDLDVSQAKDMLTRIGIQCLYNNKGV